MNEISNGIRKWDCRNRKELEERLKKIESLYYQIKRNGYKSKKELFSPKGWIERLKKPTTILDDISVVISRDGELLFFDGRHRLSIAKLLNLPKITVRIIARHKEWMDFRKKIILFAQTKKEGKLYQPFTHPDLRDIPYQHGELRFNIIKKNLSISQGTLLDIGANFGYFCHKFEDEGFDCYALEEDRRCVYFLRKLKKAEDRNFKIIPESIFEYKKNQELKFDVVFALNIFHHFLETKNTYLNFIKLLRRLKVKELFFEAHKLSGRRKRYREYNPEQFVDFIINNSHLDKAEFIGRAEDGRPLYKFTSKRRYTI